MTFGAAGADYEVVLLPTVEKRYVTLEVVSDAGEDIEALTFLNLPLRAGGDDSASPACCSLALNLKTYVPELPGPMQHPQATGYARFGLVGAKVALLVAPARELREVMKEAVGNAEELPHSPLGGPWALEAPINYGSYLIDTEGQLSVETVEEWARLAKSMGVGQLDFHTGKSMRFGDLVPNPDRYPEGLKSVKEVVDTLHDAGIAAGLHTYAFFLAKDTPWVSPVPDSRLASDASFTLSASVDASVQEIPVEESTAAMSTVTGFQVRNSITLWIDDELIVYGGINKKSPFAFSACTRGAWGTSPAPHSAGARVEHLKECFGLFVPDPGSSLFTEVAARTAAVYNQCGFDMIYLDALDGADILAGGENAWHYAAKFVFELNRRLERPALFEMSTMTHHLWFVRSRMGAWDVPPRGAKRVVDIHALANESAARMFLPANLGWWGIFNWNPVQPERTFPDDIEYLCAKALGHNASLSFLVGFTPEAWVKSANVRRLGGLIRQYEDLRLAGSVPESLRERLKTPGEEFSLEQDATGQAQFRPVRYAKHTITGPDTAEWSVTNSYEEQPLRVRIEALTSCASYEDAGSSVLLDLADPANPAEHATQDGVSLEVTPATEPAPPGVSSARISTKNTAAPQRSAWAVASRRFIPPVNLNNRGLGLWIHGDGQGELLNLQLKCPDALAGGISEHYVDIDFTGWRYVELAEPESERIGQFGWPYSRRQTEWGGTVPFLEVLHDYIIWLDYGQIGEVNVWLNNVPPGGHVQCCISPIKALPLRPIELRNPRLTINGRIITLPVILRSGDYLELGPGATCTVYNAQGEAYPDTVRVSEAIPLVATGNNSFGFLAQQTPPELSLRARVTLITKGPPLP